MRGITTRSSRRPRPSTRLNAGVRPTGSAMQTALILPAIALVLLTAIVWVRLYVERIREPRQRRIDPQSLATLALAAQTLQRVQASDNFKNLFEVPVLFYALCAVLTS